MRIAATARKRLDISRKYNEPLAIPGFPVSGKDHVRED